MRIKAIFFNHKLPMHATKQVFFHLCTSFKGASLGLRSPHQVHVKKYTCQLALYGFIVARYLASHTHCSPPVHASPG